MKRLMIRRWDDLFVQSLALMKMREERNHDQCSAQNNDRIKHQDPDCKPVLPPSACRYRTCIFLCHENSVALGRRDVYALVHVFCEPNRARFPVRIGIGP